MGLLFLWCKAQLTTSLVCPPLLRGLKNCQTLTPLVALVGTGNVIFLGKLSNTVPEMIKKISKNQTSLLIET